MQIRKETCKGLKQFIYCYAAKGGRAPPPRSGWKFRCATLLVPEPSALWFDCEGSCKGVYSKYTTQSLSIKVKQYFCE